MMLPSIVNLGPSNFSEGGLATRDLDWKDGPPKDFGEIMKGKLEMEEIPIPVKENLQTQAPMQMQALTQGGEYLKGVNKIETGSNSEKGAMLKFMDSFESELGIPSMRIVEAMAQLKPEELALSPSETAEKVIEKLDLDGTDAAIAEKLYLTMLGQMTPAAPLMGPTPAPTTVSNSTTLLTSLQEKPIVQPPGFAPTTSIDPAFVGGQPWAPIPLERSKVMGQQRFMRGISPPDVGETQIETATEKQNVNLMGLPMNSEQPLFGEVKTPKPSAFRFDTAQPLSSDPQQMPSPGNMELQPLFLQDGEGAKFIGAQKGGNNIGTKVALKAAEDETKDVDLSLLDSDTIMALQNPTSASTPFDSIISGPENASINPQLNPSLVSQNNSNVVQGLRPQDEAVLRSMMEVPKQFQQSGGFDSSGGFKQEPKKFSVETKINDQNPFMVDQTLNANNSLKETRQADTVAQVSQDFMMSPAVQKSDNPNAANIQHILNQAHYMIQRGGGEMKIELHPKELGQINLRVAVQDGRVDVQMLAETNEAKKIIETNINDLKTRLSQHQLKVDLIQVDVGNTARNNLEQNLGQQSSHHQQSQQDLGRESARQFLGQFRDGNFANRQGFVDLSNFRGYQPKKTPSSMMEPIRPKTGPRREGQSLYLVA